MIRKVSALILVTLTTALLAFACESETGQGAPPRKNGCIAESCYDASDVPDEPKDAARDS